MKKPPLLPGAILMGAQSRLLPPLLPFMFMAGGVLFHLAAWAMLALAAEDVPDYTGGPGPVLAAIHVLTLGVLAMTAMGAALQLLPVATGVGHKSLMPARVAWWFFVPGLVVLIVGFYLSATNIMMVGAFPAALALVIFGVVVGDILRRASSLRIAVAFIWLALVSLAALIVLGLGLIVDFEQAFFGDHQAAGVMHMIIAAYGFMGMLAFGVANILVPMFALSPSPPSRPGWISFGLSLAALLTAMVGLSFSGQILVLAAVVLGLAAAGFHLHGMRWSLANGMRKKLGLSFIIIKMGWAMLVVSLLLAGALALGWLGERGPALFGFVLLYGWLLTFVTGVLQRIIPFLAAMNMSKRSVKPPRLSELAKDWTLQIHATCHVTALFMCLIGIGLEMAVAVFIGAAFGVVGAVFFALFTLSVARSYLSYQASPDTLPNT